jgi:hypothetical protein
MARDRAGRIRKSNPDVLGISSAYSVDINNARRMAAVGKKMRLHRKAYLCFKMDKFARCPLRYLTTQNYETTVRQVKRIVGAKIGAYV